MFRMLWLLASGLLFCAANIQAADPVADPTAPLGFSGSVSAGAGTAANPITVTSILISSERKVAIINGEVVKENQTVKNIGALVKRIDADAVTLQQNGKVWRVALNNTAIRK